MLTTQPRTPATLLPNLMSPTFTIWGEHKAAAPRHQTFPFLLGRATFSCSEMRFLGRRGRCCPSGCDYWVSDSLSAASGYVKFSRAVRSLYSHPPHLIFHADLKSSNTMKRCYTSDTLLLQHRFEVFMLSGYLIGEAGSEHFHARDGRRYLQR